MDKYEQRAEFLKTEVKEESDVFRDEGGEYIMGNDTEGQDDDGNVSTSKGRKWYLSEEIQN